VRLVSSVRGIIVCLYGMKSGVMALSPDVARAVCAKVTIFKLRGDQTPQGFPPRNSLQKKSPQKTTKKRRKYGKKSFYSAFLVSEPWRKKKRLVKRNRKKRIESALSLGRHFTGARLSLRRQMAWVSTARVCVLGLLALSPWSTVTGWVGLTLRSPVLPLGRSIKP
jgi:hypothetical protein